MKPTPKRRSGNDIRWACAHSEHAYGNWVRHFFLEYFSLLFCLALQDAGMATLESFNINFQNNLVQNCKYGIRLSLGAAGNTVQDNTFEDLSRYNNAAIHSVYPGELNPQRLPLLFLKRTWLSANALPTSDVGLDL